MDTTNYVVVYDARTVPPLDWAELGIGLILSIVCLVLWFGGRRGWFRQDLKRGISNRYISVFGLLGFGLISVVTLLNTVIDYTSSKRLKRALETGSYVLVERTVQDFVPGDRGGHRDESWTVYSGGRVYRYQYSHARDIPGFHRSAGPIRDGLRVRIADTDGYIARLEMEKRPSWRGEPNNAQY